MEARLGLLEKCLIAAFATGLLFAFRYPLVIDPIAHAVTARQQAFHDDVQAARDRVALEDTARFINESMPSSAYSPTKFDLLKKSVAAAKLNGLFCEFGVYKGTTVNFISALVPDRDVHGFDSFEGLPEAWRDGYGKSTFAIRGLPPVNRNVKLHKGWFNQTVPQFSASTRDPIAFIHMDADLYSSTRTVLEGLADRFVAGTVVQFDEFFGYPGWRSGEYKAFIEFAASRKLRYDYLGYSREQVALILR
jgi:hypothetical protein